MGSREVSNTSKTERAERARFAAHLRDDGIDFGESRMHGGPPHAARVAFELGADSGIGAPMIFIILRTSASQAARVKKGEFMTI